jgi:hypothetical protein
MSKELKLRVIQLDLARQMETLEYIRTYIDFAAGNGYNALGLYLEGRIRTKSFPYPAEDESYSPGEMREIVKYAAERNLELIPVISFLGHVEMFLKYKELEHLAELRGDAKGRFVDLKTVFCPSVKETRTFIEKYISEIIDIFPSRYFHAGCDEAWDIGICPLCRNRDGGESGIFVKHVNDLHKIIAGKYKKKMIIWDDLFENYPDALPAIPRDIIMCSWHYDNLVDIPRSHFNNRLKIDKFAEYDRLGFEYFLAPSANYNYRNTETFTEYARKYKPLGGWMTVWSLSHTFHFREYPLIAYAGRLWYGEDIAFECLIEKLFGINDTKFVKAVKAVYTSGLSRHIPENFLAGALCEEESVKNAFVESVFETLKYYEAKNLDRLQQDIFEDLLTGLEIDLQSGILREILPPLVNPRTPEKQKREITAVLEPVIMKFREIKKKRKQQWSKHRPGIKPCSTDSYFSNIIKTISEFKERPVSGIMNVELFLPEFHSVQTTAFFVKYKGERNWKKVAKGVYKQEPCKGAFYTYSFPIPLEKIPEAVRIDSWGYGGQGITYMEFITGLGRYVPHTLTGTDGKVIDPEYVLDNDCKWCFMGEKNTSKAFLNAKTAEEVHSVGYNLIKSECDGYKSQSSTPIPLASTFANSLGTELMCS